MKRISIRKQVQRLLFLCSMVSLFLMGGIALLGMMGARENLFPSWNLPLL